MFNSKFSLLSSEVVRLFPNGHIYSVAKKAPSQIDYMGRGVKII